MFQRLKNLWAWSAMHPYRSTHLMPAAKHAEPELRERVNKRPIVKQPISPAKIIEMLEVDEFKPNDI